MADILSPLESATAIVRTNQMTDDEAALYDRQIRLWGVEAQRRLREANVLIAGVDGVGSEIVKNIVLAGVNSLTLIDNAVITQYDTMSNLFTLRQLGESRVVVAAKQVQALNPMVKITHEVADVGSKDEQYFQQFQVVCLSGFDKQTMIKVNAICRKLAIKFYAVNTWGMFAFGFVDLGKQHTFKTEEVIRGEDETIGNEEPAKKKVKLEENVKQVVEKTVDFVPLDVSLAVKAGKPGIGLTKKTTNIFIITHIILAFHEKHSRFPSTQSRESDLEELGKLEGQVLESLGLDESVLKNCPDWRKFVFGQLSPICAVTGGVIGQDIITAVSRKDPPIRNIFLFNGLECSGHIESIGK